LIGATIADHTLLLENDRTRITQWVFAPGDQTRWHNHTHDYVTVQQSGGALLLQAQGGSGKRIEYQAGRTLSWKAPIIHNAINISDVKVRMLEIELKSTDIS